MSTHEQRLRLAELTSSLGAGVLGLGLGVLAAAALRDLVGPILVAGGVMHVWGMFDKHRLERAAGAKQPWWSALLYWLCWAALAVLALCLMLRATS